MQLTRVAEGLWHWTEARHATTIASMLRGSVYYEAPDALVLIDPVVPDGGEADRFWRALDADVSRVALQPVVILTMSHPGRAHSAIQDRYQAPTVRAWEHDTRRPDTASSHEGRLPKAVKLRRCGRDDERAIWLPLRQSLVIGDFVRGVDGKNLALSAAAETRPVPRSAPAELAALSQLKPHHVLTCMGPPVIDRGSEALSQALG